MHLARFGRLTAWSTSTPMPPDAVRGADRLEGALSGQAGDLEDDVGVTAGELAGERLALGRVVEPDRRVRIGLLVEDLDVRLDRLGAVLVAAPVVGDGRDVRCRRRRRSCPILLRCWPRRCPRGSPAGPRRRRCPGSSAGAWRRRPRTRTSDRDRLGVDADALVDTDELDVGVGLGGLGRVGPDEEADGDDDVEVARRRRSGCSRR